MLKIGLSLDPDECIIQRKKKKKKRTPLLGMKFLIFNESHVIILLVFMEMIMGMVSLMGSLVLSEMRQCEYKH